MATIYDNQYLNAFILVDLYPYNIDQEEVEHLGVSSEYYGTQASDSPANFKYFGVLSDNSPVAFTREVIGGGAIIGQAIPDKGAITVLNVADHTLSKGKFDDWLDNSKYAWSGRRIVISVLLKGAAYSTRTQVLDALIDDFNFTENTITFAIKSQQQLFDEIIQPNTYAGSGGVEGTSSLIGKYKPLVFGRCEYVATIPVDYSNLIFQIHDGEIQEVEKVYDIGAEIALDTGVGTGGDVADYAALVSATVTGGEYATCLAEGLIKLGSTPSDTPRVRVKGSTLGGTYSARAGAIFTYLIPQYSELSSVSSAAMTAIDAAAAFDVGYYCGTEPVSIAMVCDKFMNSLGGYYGINRNGEFDAGIILPLTTTGSLSVNEDLDIEDQGLTVEKYNQPIYEVIANYRPTVSPHDYEQVAGSVKSSDNSFAIQISGEGLTHREIDNATKTLYPNAKQFVLSTCLYDAAAANTIAERWLTFLKVPRYKYTINTLNLKPLQVNLNDGITITHSRFNLSAGEVGTIVGLTEDYLRAKVSCVAIK